MNFYLWVLSFAIGSILVIFLLMYIVQKILDREQRDPEFAKKLGKFRDIMVKIEPTEGQKQFIAVLLFFLFIYYVNSTR